MEKIIYECPKGCHNYKQSLEEIVDAGNRHKAKLITAYAIAEDLKKKVSSLRAEKNHLLENIDQLEIDGEHKEQELSKVKRENTILKYEIKEVKKENEENMEIVKIKNVSTHEIESFKEKIFDLEEELFFKNQKLSEMVDSIPQHKSIQRSLKDELEIEKVNCDTDLL